jgi:hypothetical protein
MSYKAPLASTTGYGIVQVGAGISVTDGVISGSTGLLNYGFVSSSTTQNNAGANLINLITFDVTPNPPNPINGVNVLVGDPTQIVVDNAGVYTKQFTVILNKTAGGTSSISIWLRYNNVDLPGSRQELQLVNTLSELFVSGNFTLDMAAGSSIEMCWSSPDATVSLVALPAAVTPTRPSGFSAKITLTRIS